MNLLNGEKEQSRNLVKNFFKGLSILNQKLFLL